MTKSLPSMSNGLVMINAIPANSNGSVLSSRNTALSTIALTGTRSDDVLMLNLDTEQAAACLRMIKSIAS